MPDASWLESQLADTYARQRELLLEGSRAPCVRPGDCSVFYPMVSCPRHNPITYGALYATHRKNVIP